jgi:hypothetical protein
MRHSVPHRNNIGVEPPACKSFLGPVGPRGPQRLDPRGGPVAVFVVHLRINPFKSADYVGSRRAARVSAATEGDGRHATGA